MKKIISFNLLLFIIVVAVAQQKVIPLYAGAAPGSESWTWGEAENDKNSWQTRVVYNVSKPTLTLFAPDPAKANGTAVIICPGGAFHALSIDSEGFDVAKWLTQKGVTCFVLKYRLARSFTTDPVAEVMAKWGKKEFNDANAAAIPLAIADGKAAIAYVRSHALDFNINPERIGIMGFSAGGTVTSGSLFNYTAADKPNFAAPIYAFFTEEMMGNVSKDAPPLFVAAATDDGLGLAPHSIGLYKKWTTAQLPAELHMYAKGGHGFGMRKQNLPSDNWIERFNDWLDMQGLLKKAASNPAYALFERKEFAAADGKKLPYRILFPEGYDKTKKYPLLLLLHGGGERGNDNEKQLTHGAKLFLTETNRKNFQAIVVMPQCAEDTYWASAKIDRTTQPFKIEVNYTATPNWPLVAANELVKQLITTEAVDKNRVYISGLSMGGMGTFESVYRYPELYAAALPICGVGDATSYDKRVARIPFWVFHGDADVVVDVKNSRIMVEKLKALKAAVKYTEYPGVNHNSWDSVFADPEYLNWMLQQKRKK